MTCPPEPKMIQIGSNDQSPAAGPIPTSVNTTCHIVQAMLQEKSKRSWDSSSCRQNLRWPSESSTILHLRRRSSVDENQPANERDSESSLRFHREWIHFAFYIHQIREISNGSRSTVGYPWFTARWYICLVWFWLHIFVEWSEPDSSGTKKTTIRTATFQHGIRRAPQARSGSKIPVSIIYLRNASLLGLGFVQVRIQNCYRIDLLLGKL